MSFYFPKFIWLFINPYSIFIFLLLFCLFLYLLKLKKLFKFFFISSVIIILILSSLPLGKFLINILEKEYYFYLNQGKQIDGILILAGATKPTLFKNFNQINVNENAERIIESIIMIRKNPQARTIFSGGSKKIDMDIYSHSEAAKFFFEKMDLNTNKIIFENSSKNTYENILFSFDIAKPKNNENWIVITSAFHMKRSLLIAEKIGWNLNPYPVDFKTTKKLNFYPNLEFFNNLKFLQIATREWLSLLSYYFQGRIDRIF